MSRQREFGQFDGGKGEAAAKRGKRPKPKKKAKPAAKERAERGGSKQPADGGVDMAGVRRAMGRGRSHKG